MAVAIFDLPRDLEEEVLSRAPLASLRSVRLTCKKWNTLSKDESFTKKLIAHAKSATDKDEFMAVMILGFRVCFMSINLRGEINHNVDASFIKPQGKLITLNDEDHQVDISRVFHCDGLLLCITKDIKNSRLVVCNPYSGQTLRIKPKHSYHFFDRYALGYDKNKNNSLPCHKVLRILDNYNLRLKCRVREFEIYNVKSSSWKVLLGLAPEWYIDFDHHGVSVKGKTYWFGGLRPRDISDMRDLLICFDFTTERFAPHLHMPVQASYQDTVTLSTVGEEQLAVLLQPSDLKVHIWVTTKIEPEDVSWSLFLSVDMAPLAGSQFVRNAGSFFVDQKGKVAVVFDKDQHGPISRKIAYVMGENGYVEKVDLGESREEGCCWPRACS